MNIKEQILRIFPKGFRDSLENSGMDFDKLCAIRIRADKPVSFLISGEEYFIDINDRLRISCENGVSMSASDIRLIMELVSNYSLYAFADEIRNGFITIQGGHRIGISGSVLLDNGRISNIKYISALNIRVAHQVRGCADNIIEYLFRGEEFVNTLIVSPCGRGKTTLLRDIIRQLSDGSRFHKGMNVAVVDERSEIGACFHGIPQNDLGLRTDVMEGCQKAIGMQILIRSMAPEIIALDELGGVGELDAVRTAISSGAGLIATVHAGNYCDLKGRPYMKKILSEGLIDRLIFLKGTGKPGHIHLITDGKGGEIKKW